MALVLENGIWKLEADGVAATPVSLALTPSIGAPESIVDGTTLETTMFSGWKVQNPDDTSVTAISDDGSVFAMTCTAVGGAVETGTSFTINPSLYYPTRLAGDFEASLKVFGDSSMGTNASYAGIAIGNRVSGDDPAAFGAVSRGGYLATSTRTRSSVALINTSSATYFTQDSTYVAWGTSQWIQIKRVGGVITASRKTLDGDAWTVVQTDALDVCGAEFTLSLLFRTTTTSIFSMEEFNFTGFEA